MLCTYPMADLRNDSSPSCSADQLVPGIKGCKQQTTSIIFSLTRCHLCIYPPDSIACTDEVKVLLEVWILLTGTLHPQMLQPRIFAFNLKLSHVGKAHCTVCTASHETIDSWELVHPGDEMANAFRDWSQIAQPQKQRLRYPIDCSENTSSTGLRRLLRLDSAWK